MTEQLRQLQQEARNAWDFYNTCKGDPTSLSTGAMRDAREWLSDIVQRMTVVYIPELPNEQYYENMKKIYNEDH